MRKLIVLFGIVLLCAGMVHAQEDELIAVLITEENLVVDSIALTFPPTETVPTPDFGGENVIDTFNFGMHRDMVKAALIWFSIDGEPREPVEIPDITADEWYPLEGFQPGQIKFLMWNGGIEERPWHAAQARMSAYPNPFLHRTRLSVRLTRRARVAIELFDESGARVRSIAAGEFAAGEHHWSWDGCDADGRRVAGGVYLARLAAGDERSLVKLVLSD